MKYVWIVLIGFFMGLMIGRIFFPNFVDAIIIGLMFIVFTLFICGRLKGEGMMAWVFNKRFCFCLFGFLLTLLLFHNIVLAVVCLGVSYFIGIWFEGFLTRLEDAWGGGIIEKIS